MHHDTACSPCVGLTPADLLRRGPAADDSLRRGPAEADPLQRGPAAAGPGASASGVLKRWRLHLLMLGHPDVTWPARVRAAARWGYDVSVDQATSVPQLARRLATLPPCDLLVLAGDAADLSAGALAPGGFTPSHWQRLLDLPGVLVVHLSGQPGDEALGRIFSRAGASGYLAPREPLRGAEAQAYLLDLLQGWRERAVQVAMARASGTDASTGRLQGPSGRGMHPPLRGGGQAAARHGSALRRGLHAGRRAAQALLSAGSLALLPVLGAIGVLGSLPAQAQQGQRDEAAVRQSLMTLFDRPEARLTVTPVVVVDRHAVAGWMQGDRGGRALLERNAQGEWLVVLCSGAALRDAKFLRDNGMSAAQAERMARTVAQSEKDLAAAQVALLDSFDGLVRMDAQGRHPPMDHGGGHGSGHGGGQGAGHGADHGDAHGAQGQGQGQGHGAAHPPAGAASGGGHKHH